MVRIALAQINPTVGDIKGNTEIIEQLHRKAANQKADLLVFPELCISGYPPEDLLLKTGFVEEQKKALKKIAANYPDIRSILGFCEQNENGRFNSAALLAGGEIKQVYNKYILPNYGVFDEKRYFKQGGYPVFFEIDGIRFTLTICEDIWQPEKLQTLFKDSKPDFVINLSASPFHTQKILQRQAVFKKFTEKFQCPLAYCNITGAQDELVFDGRSCFVSDKGKIICRAKSFEQDILVADLSINRENQLEIKPCDKTFTCGTNYDELFDIYNALIFGLSDYVRKNGFSKVVIGLSGGIDSSLTAVIAVKALGVENVIGITMPSEFNSPETIQDAETLAENLDITFYKIPIGDIMKGFDSIFTQIPNWNDKGIAYENLQSRIRGTILMSLSNHNNWMVLAAGNKSETAVGYSTLYGDTAGGFAVLKDVPKTMVYKISKLINKNNHFSIIPQSVLNRPPSAELKAEQKDSDLLGDYETLDKILTEHIEQQSPIEKMSTAKIEKKFLTKIINMIDANEFKRRQLPTGIKITQRAFGKDRRMPITNLFDLPNNNSFS
jgi:NAD+ synthase (glutamine-hydrolysing)